jgi:Probable Zinc-ribbon domain
MAKVTPNYNLAVIHPKIAAQWHPTRNSSLTPSHIGPSSSKLIWWLCKKGHEWNETVSNRAHSRTGCPYCSGQRVCADNCLETVFPHIARQWHPTKNKDLTPNDVTVGSDKRVWWICKKGHEWQTQVSARRRGYGCPYCSGRRATKDHSLQTKYPDLAAQWHPAKNGGLLPTDVSPRSSKKRWWICGKGHEWEAIVSNRTEGKGCPYCVGKKAWEGNCLATLAPHIAREWHPHKNGDLTPRDVTCGSNKKVWWMCRKGHEWEARIDNRHHGTGCPLCKREKAGKRLRNL